MIKWSFGKFHLEDLEQFQLGTGHCYNRQWESHNLCYNHKTSCGHVRFLIIQESSKLKDPIRHYSCHQHSSCTMLRVPHALSQPGFAPVL